MAKKKLPNSIRKHIRKQKAQIARKFSDDVTRKEEVAKLYARFLSGENAVGAPKEAPEKKEVKVAAKPKKDAKKGTTKKSEK